MAKLRNVQVQKWREATTLLVLAGSCLLALNGAGAEPTVEQAGLSSGLSVMSAAACPSFDELVCICISEMITKNTKPANGQSDKDFKEDAESITDIVACRKRDWGHIGQVACDKELCDSVKGDPPTPPKNWPGNSKRNLESCAEAARKTIAKCAGGDGGTGSGGGGAGALNCKRKHWYHQDDPGFQKKDNDNNPYNNDPYWMTPDILNDPSTKKRKYKNFGQPDPVWLILPEGVSGKDRPGPYDQGGACQKYTFPRS